MILYRVLGAKDDIKEGWFSFRNCYKTPDGSKSLNEAVSHWFSFGPGGLDVEIESTPESAHEPPNLDPLLAPFWNNFYKNKKDWQESKYDWYCAFMSLKQLKDVFQGKSQRAFMSSIGVRLAVFKVHSRYVVKSDQQCLFLIDKAYDVKYHPLSYIEEV